MTDTNGIPIYSPPTCCPEHGAVCGRCGMPAHKVAGATENGQPVEIWHHDSVADDVFCGLVMHAADRLPR